MVVKRQHQVQLGHMVKECHQVSLGYEWKSIPNHSLSTKGRVLNAYVVRFGNQVMSLEVGMHS